MSVSRDGAELPTVLCADVDGTILRTDLLYESFLSALKEDPTVIIRAIFWLLKGKAYLKNQLAKRRHVSVETMPLRKEVVAYLKTSAAEGRTIVLASASHYTLVEALADRLGFVHEVLATKDGENLKGEKKAAVLVERFGEKGFEYIGDSSADLHVWRHAGAVSVVAGSKSFQDRVISEFPGAHVFPVAPRRFKTFARALRVYQWLKNVLVFLPLILAHRVLDVPVVVNAIGAFASFSLCASGVYLLNDLLDLEADRSHHRKKHRPCAAGDLPIPIALLMVPFLFLGGFSIALWVSTEFALVLVLYLLLTTAYSFRLKQIALVDIILLAILYSIRIIGGGIATEVHVSQWLLGVSMFMFLSLACVKRFSELLVLREKNERKTRGRGYLIEDMEQIAMFGSSSAYISVLVLALYISSKEVVELYRSPHIIWLACPLVLYWVSRVWLLARRGLVHDDPLVFAMRDRVTYIIGGLAVMIFAAAKCL